MTEEPQFYSETIEHDGELFCVDFEVFEGEVEILEVTPNAGPATIEELQNTVESRIHQSGNGRRRRIERTEAESLKLEASYL